MEIIFVSLQQIEFDPTDKEAQSTFSALPASAFMPAGLYPHFSWNGKTFKFSMGDF